MSSIANLPPCPFCGSENVEMQMTPLKGTYGQFLRPEYYVICKHCHCRTSMYWEIREAEEHWKDRCPDIEVLSGTFDRLRRWWIYKTISVGLIALCDFFIVWDVLSGEPDYAFATLLILLGLGPIALVVEIYHSSVETARENMEKEEARKRKAREEAERMEKLVK